MKYVNANQVLPPSLLEELQHYIQGELIYIPKIQREKKAWGSNTKTREILARRNEEIVKSFNLGMSVAQLADRYALAEGTIKKIVYAKS